MAPAKAPVPEGADIHKAPAHVGTSATLDSVAAQESRAAVVGHTSTAIVALEVPAQDLSLRQEL